MYMLNNTGERPHPFLTPILQSASSVQFTSSQIISPSPITSPSHYWWFDRILWAWL